MPFFQSARRHSRQFLPRSKTVVSRESEFPLGGILSECIKVNLHGLLWVNELRMNGPEEGWMRGVSLNNAFAKNDQRAAKGYRIVTYLLFVKAYKVKEKNVNEFT